MDLCFTTVIHYSYYFSTMSNQFKNVTANYVLTSEYNQSKKSLASWKQWNTSRPKTLNNQSGWSIGCMSLCGPHGPHNRHWFHLGLIMAKKQWQLSNAEMLLRELIKNKTIALIITPTTPAWTADVKQDWWIPPCNKFRPAYIIIVEEMRSH